MNDKDTTPDTATAAGAEGLAIRGAATFGASDFIARAQLQGHPLGIAPWMAEQPLSYGIDAGSIVDGDGNVQSSPLETLVAPDKWKTSAVLIPVIRREPEVTVLLTLRTSHLSAHGGQIAFPGGKIETQDATPVDTALREAHEEIGLPPDLVAPLSLLDLHKTGTGYRIIPVIGMVEPGFVPAPDPNEVADVFEIPLSFLMHGDNHIRHYRQWEDRRILFYAMSFEDRFIWGATAAIIRNLYERLYATLP